MCIIYICLYNYTGRIDVFLGDSMIRLGLGFIDILYICTLCTVHKSKLNQTSIYHTCVRYIITNQISFFRTLLFGVFDPLKGNKKRNQLHKTDT